MPHVPVASCRRVSRGPSDSTVFSRDATSARTSAGRFMLAEARACSSAWALKSAAGCMAFITHLEGNNASASSTTNCKEHALRYLACLHPCTD